MSDKEAQDDEILALASIYESNVFSSTEENGLYSGEFRAFPQLPQPFYVVKSFDENEKTAAVEYLPPITLHFELPVDYPSISPPAFTLSCKWLNKKQLTTLCEKLDKIWAENQGDVVLFHWINYLNEESLTTLSIGGSLNLSDAILPKIKYWKTSGRDMSCSSLQGDEKEKELYIINNRSNFSKRDQVCQIGSCEEDKGRTSNSTFLKPQKRAEIRKEENRTFRECHLSPPNTTSSYSCYKNSSSRNRFGRPRRGFHSHSRKYYSNSRVDSFQENEKKKYTVQDPSKMCDSSLPANVLKYDDRAVQETISEAQLLTVILDYNKLRQQQVFDASFITCKICFEEKLGLNCKAFKPCNHVFCKVCLKSYFEIQISTGCVNRLNCPEEKCSSQALPSLVRELVEPELFTKYDQLLLSTTLDTMSDIVYCPRRSCHCPVLVEPESNMGSCPSCFHVFCIYCKMTYHGVEPCKLQPDEQKKIVHNYMNGNHEEKKLLEQRYGRQQVKQLVDNILSEEWISDNSKGCPNCKAHIEKLDGCNKMTCWRCDSYFCWICMTQLNKGNPYSHYNDLHSPCNGKLFQGVNIEVENDSEEDEEDWNFGEFL